jgi:2-(1,2-epoxy-1,2-dihydrophenyl)acetyl-CoA isomerase
MAGGNLIKVEMDGKIAIVKMDDPSTRNAMSEIMGAELLDVLRDLEGKVRAIVLTGEGKGFCSGAKLIGEGGADPGVKDLGVAMREIYNPLIQTLHDLKVPLISAVNGPAAGIGGSLSMIADLSVVADSAVFVQAFPKVGLVPDGASAFINVKSAGRARAMELALLDEPLSPAQALEWGMINRVVPLEELMPTALKLAKRLANGPTRSYAGIRKLMWHACEGDFASQVALEAELQSELGFSNDHAEGVRSFIEREKPNFTGE